GHGLILRLAAPLGRAHRELGGWVGEPHAARGLVAVLASRARGDKEGALATIEQRGVIQRQRFPGPRAALGAHASGGGRRGRGGGRQTGTRRGSDLSRGTARSGAAAWCA